MSGSAAVGAMATGTLLAALVITTSKPENPTIREANWRYYLRNLKWDSEALYVTLRCTITPTFTHATFYYYTYVYKYAYIIMSMFTNIIFIYTRTC